MAKFILNKLPYSFDALEPYIDAKTMEIHYTKHHQTYADKLNEAIEGTDFKNMDIEEIFKYGDLPLAIRNNGGGFYNHNLFWELMGPNAGGEPKGSVGGMINMSFGTFDNFRDEFTKAALSRFGSGWAWLVLKDGNNLKITSTPNQDNPLMMYAEEKGKPILVLDVWEHAYYLKYQNRRAEYIQNWWNVVNWNKVEEMTKQITG